MKLISALCVVFFLAVCSGCVTPPKGEGKRDLDQGSKGPIPKLISSRAVESRIAFLEKTLAREELSEQGRKVAEELLATYQLAERLSGRRLTKEEYQVLVRSLFRSLSLVDEGYFQKGKCASDYPEAVSRFVAGKRKIIELYLKGDFKGVIEACLRLEETLGPDSLTPEVGLLFALSLAEEGRLEQAVQIGEGVAETLDQIPDIVELRSKIALWKLQLGNRDSALRVYAKLTDIQDERAALIREVQRRISLSKRPQPVGSVDSNPPGSSPGGTPEPGEEGLDRLMARVNVLVRKHSYDKARALLVKARSGMEEGPETEIIDRELEKIDREEEDFEVQKQIRDAYLKNTLETAKKLVEEEKFKDALARLNEVEEMGDLPPEYGALRERVVESIINRERNRAAEIFLEAKKARDPAKKRELLQSSYEILKTLVDKYPSSPLNQKLRSHMAAVKREMARLKQD